MKKLNKNKLSKNLFFIILSSLLIIFHVVFKVTNIGLLGNIIIDDNISFIKAFASPLWK
jgi:hypothetical protein